VFTSKKKYWIKLFSSIFVILLLTLIGKNLSKNNEKGLKIKTLEIIKKCKDETQTLNSLNSACMTQHFEKIVTKQNLGFIMDTLEEIFQNEENKIELGSPTCHAPGHVVGKIGREKGITLDEFWEICSLKCGYGCLHGGLIGNFKEEGGEFLSSYKNACDNIISYQSDEQLRSCWHVVGHGLGEIFGEDIETAVTKCLELPVEKYKRHCIDGVRMEYVTGVSYNPLRENISADTIISFCKRFPQDFQDNCYVEASYYTYRVSGNEDNAIAVCNKIPTSLNIKKLCAFGGGYAFISVYINSPNEFNEHCKKFGASLVKDCILGAVNFLTGREPLGKIKIICELNEGLYLSECLSFFGENLEMVSGKESRNLVCSELDNVNESACLKKPFHLMNYLEPEIN